ncbi:MAG: endonuclease/exonuclease/phosphatase family protein [Candidatus Eisenbacteria bacterium]|nr:endonuclease/exonuclease/phosphatase family protein [Candidatus Eisenbacteria bacterium]
MTYPDFVAASGACRTEAEFRNTPFFHAHGGALDELLRTPRPIGGPPGQRLPPSAELSLVHWNIEKGKQLGRIRQRLREEPRLRDADVWCLNEVDDGMARTGNRDIAAEVADELGAAGFFLPTYIECTKGLPAERIVPGENRLGLHGLAILTRRPVRNVTVLELPPAWDYFDYSEKRFGGRRALVVRIDAGFGPVEVIATHLEMRSPPVGRSHQVRALLESYESLATERGKSPALVVGDLNTHTFSRGRTGDTLRGFLRVVGTESSRLSHELLHPEQREGLFAEFARYGWRREGYNDAAPTAWQELGHVEDLNLLPPALGRLVLKSFRLDGRRLPLRLDWIFGKSLTPLEAATIDSVVAGEGPASDHEPIWVRVGPA